METIKNYLETMFQNLPNTIEVKRAKHELGQMMEDKYMDLKAEGKSENEAVGIVISEFGNLDEIADDLGISVYVKEENVIERRMVSTQEVKDYINEKSRYGFMIGLGVLLCIISPCGVIITENIYGILFLFVAITVAVGMFVFSGVSMGKWEFLKRDLCSIDFSTTEYVHNQKENYRMTNALMNTIGVVLCVFCCVPVIIISEFDRSGRLDVFGVVLLLVLVAIGVVLFVSTGNRMSAYDTILKLNSEDTIGGNFVASQKGQVRYSNKTLAAIMSVYWPTVTCFYLCWSFLSGAWHITWIVWVIAGIFETFIKNMNRN